MGVSSFSDGFALDLRAQNECTLVLKLRKKLNLDSNISSYTVKQGKS